MPRIHRVGLYRSAPSSTVGAMPTRTLIMETGAAIGDVSADDLVTGAVDESGEVVRLEIPRTPATVAAVKEASTVLYRGEHFSLDSWVERFPMREATSRIVINASRTR